MHSPFRRVTMLLLLLPLAATCTLGFLPNDSEARRVEPRYDTSTLLVKFADHDAQSTAVLSRHNLGQVQRLFPVIDAKRAKSTGLDRVYQVAVPPHADLDAVLADLRSDKSVAYAEPNLILGVLATPNDPYYASSDSWGQGRRDMYGLPQIGLGELGDNSGWDIERDETGAIVVAVIDTGLDFSHPDGPTLWTNPGEIPGNGIDDNGSGYIDDVNGWNFVANNNNFSDGHGHGTHVIGTIAARTDNALGVAGISWGSRIMPLKGLGDNGSGSVVGLAQALIYAADNGAHIISNSWGGVGTSSTLEDAVNYAIQAGCLVIAAAGNSDADVELHGFIPAMYDGVLTVAALDHNDNRAWFSNFGAAVEISAPGVDILSLRAAGTDMYGTGAQIVGQDYYRASGTSMACPHVSGVAALVWAHNPTWDAVAVTNQLIQTTDYIDNLNPGFENRLGRGRLNAYKALTTQPKPDLVVTHVDVVAPESLYSNNALDPGECAALRVEVLNRWLGAQAATGRLISRDPYAQVATEITAFGNVPQGATAVGGPNLALCLAQDAPYGHALDVVLEITANGGYQVEVPLGLTVAAPLLDVRAVDILDTGGNNNGILEPGETAQVWITLQNGTRAALADTVTAVLSSNDGHLTILQPTAAYGSIPPGASRANTAGPFVLQLSAAASPSAPIELSLSLEARHGYQAVHELTLTPPGVARESYRVVGPGWPPLILLPLSANLSADGAIHVAYSAQFVTTRPLHYGRFSGGVWSGPGPLTSQVPEGRDILVSNDTAGTPHLSWIDTRMAPGWQPVPLFVAEVHHVERLDTGWPLARGVSESWEIEAVRSHAMAVDTQDRPHVVWQYMDWGTPNRLYWRHRVRDGKTWRAFDTIHQTNDVGRTYHGMRLTTASNGALWLTWVRGSAGSEQQWNLYGMRWHGESWSTPTVLQTVNHNVLGTYQLDIDAQERLHLVWSAHDQVNNQRYYTVSAPGGGNWSPVEAVAQAGANGTANSLFHDPRTDLLYLGYVSNGAFRVLVRENGAWQPPRHLRDLEPGEVVASLRLLPDRRGHLHLIWNSVVDFTLGRTQQAFYAAHQLLPPPGIPAGAPSLELR